MTWKHLGNWLLLIALFFSLEIIIGCDGNNEDNGNGPSNDPVIVTVVNGSQTEEFNLRDLPSIEVHYPLNTPISKLIMDYRIN